MQSADGREFGPERGVGAAHGGGRDRLVAGDSLFLQVLGYCDDGHGWEDHLGQDLEAVKKRRKEWMKALKDIFENEERCLEWAEANVHLLSEEGERAPPL